MTGAEIPILTQLAIAAAVTGGTIAAVGTIQQGKAQAASIKANAKFNAAVKRDEAAQKVAAGKLEADRLRRRRINLTKSQRVGFAKSGVTSEGTPIDVMIQSAAEEELNANLAQHNFQVGAARSRSEASLFDFQRRGAGRIKSASRFQAGASLLGGISQAGVIGASA